MKTRPLRRNLWNLVFMQYEQVDANTQFERSPSIDTGMGLERIAAVLQGVHDNYDTDTFKALITASGEISGNAARPAPTRRRIASSPTIQRQRLPDCRRRAARRATAAAMSCAASCAAMRHAHLLGTTEPLMYRLSRRWSAKMGAAYPELVRAQSLIEETLKLEETRFRQTLANGLRLLDEATAKLKSGDTLAGAVAFKLYDTFGFPYDLTEDAPRAHGIGVDRAGLRRRDGRAKRARAAWGGSGQAAADSVRHCRGNRPDRIPRLRQRNRAGPGAGADRRRRARRPRRCRHQGRRGHQPDAVLRRIGRAGVGELPRIEAGAMRATVSDTSKPLGKLHVHRRGRYRQHRGG